MPSQTAAPPQQGQAAPGTNFSIPPFTDEVEQPDNNDLVVAVASQTAQVPVNGIVPFMQSDVIYGWVMEVSPAHTETDGTATITVSPYSPYIHLGPLLLNMQYQYPSISVATGMDLALLNGYRPIVVAKRGNRNFDVNFPTASSNAPGIQPQQLFTGIAHSTGVAQTPTFITELPAACWFDSYYELDETGMPVSGPHNGFVSPQNMGGYARVVTPSLRLNQYITVTPTVGGFDQSVYYSAGTQTTPATTTGMNTTFGFSRIGVLGSLDASVLPQPTNWQYNIAHQQVSVSGLSKVSVPLNGIFAGQIMSIIVRLFDPTIANGGGPIPVANVASYQLQYGGSVQRFTGGSTTAGTTTSVKRLQRRFFEQHLYLPPEGCLIYDMAMDRQLNITNSYLLNTLRTAAVQLNLVFTAAQNAGAYAEVTIEGLRWVPLPVNPAQ